MRVLGIETSCDETAAAVVEDGRCVLSNIVASQLALHQKYGGVVPELAARHHIERIHPVLEEALAVADVGWEEVDAVAVTRGPGLVVALLVGLQAAKGVALARGIPLVGVHHLAGHVSALYLEAAMQEPDGIGGPESPPLPFVALVVSGGHTHLYRVEDPFSFRCLGATRDDAAGEAYDKVARLLGLGYPGGPILDALAAEVEGEPSIQFPRPILDDGGLDFSFSGLKTAVLYHLMDLGLYTNDPALPPLERARGIGEDLRRQIAHAFQAAVVEVLTEKALRAVRQEGCRALAVVGGVAANQGLRTRLRRRSVEEGVGLYVPAVPFCTDNAAMIASAGYFLLKAGRQTETQALRLDADAGWELSS